MKTYVLTLCIGASLFLSATNVTLAVEPSFDEWVKPITSSELLRIIHSTDTTPEQHAIAIRRATYSRLEEIAVAAYRTEAEHHPKDPTLQSAFGLIYFNETLDAGFGQYKPSDPSLWQQQLQDVDLRRAATAAVEGSSQGDGKRSWFCWFALGECHLIGLIHTEKQRQNIHEQAQHELTEAVRLNPNSSVLHTWFAFACLSPVSSIQDAVREAQKATALDRTNATAYDVESRAYEALKNYKAAYALKKRAIALTPPGHPVPASMYRSLAYLKQCSERDVSQ